MISDDYIMGLVEGEGCFCVAIGKDIDRKPRKTGRKNNRKNASMGFRVKPSFRITLVSEDSRVLYAIKERLQVGKIYALKRSGMNRRPASQYYVDTMPEIEKAVEFFQDKQFHTTKGHSFKLWLECLEIIKNKGHLTKDGLLRICELRDEMNPRLGGKNSRTVDIIKKILEIKPEHIEVHAKQAQLIHNPNQLDLAKWHRKRQGAFKLEEINPLSAQTQE